MSVIVLNYFYDETDESASLAVNEIILLGDPSIDFRMLSTWAKLDMLFWGCELTFWYSNIPDYLLFTLSLAGFKANFL